MGKSILSFLIFFKIKKNSNKEINILLGYRQTIFGFTKVTAHTIEWLFINVKINAKIIVTVVFLSILVI